LAETVPSHPTSPAFAGPSRSAERLRRSDTVLVIGLGRFGSALATSLEDMGHDVLGVDLDPGLVADHASALSQVMEADTTRLDTLRQIGAEDVGAAVVAIGTDIEASILTTAALVDLGVTPIWAKALTEPHARILERIGASEVVFPERDMGVRVAHQVTGRMIDWFQLDDGFALVETRAPASMIGKTLQESQARRPLRRHRRQHQAGGFRLHLRHRRHGDRQGRRAAGRRRHEGGRGVHQATVTIV
jgi:trk system potassium uptake protein TrkA